jgi:thiol-disulfide isomerase/thioredoxin
MHVIRSAAFGYARARTRNISLRRGFNSSNTTKLDFKFDDRLPHDTPPCPSQFVLLFLMAGRRKKGAPIVALDSDDAFQAAIEQSTKFLIVVDIHQGWCGPCTTMEPIYNKAYIELDRAEDRLKFFTIDAEKLSAESRKGLPVTESCKPLFVVFKVQMRASFPSPHRALTAYAPPPSPRTTPLSLLFLRAEQGASYKGAGCAGARAGNVSHGQRPGGAKGRRGVKKGKASARGGG